MGLLRMSDLSHSGLGQSLLDHRSQAAITAPGGLAVDPIASYFQAQAPLPQVFVPEDPNKSAGTAQKILQPWLPATAIIHQYQAGKQLKEIRKIEQTRQATAVEIAKAAMAQAAENRRLAEERQGQLRAARLGVKLVIDRGRGFLSLATQHARSGIVEAIRYGLSSLKDYGEQLEAQIESVLRDLVQVPPFDDPASLEQLSNQKEELVAFSVDLADKSKSYQQQVSNSVLAAHQERLRAVGSGGPATLQELLSSLLVKMDRTA